MMACAVSTTSSRWGREKHDGRWGKYPWVGSSFCFQFVWHVSILTLHPCHICNKATSTKLQGMVSYHFQMRMLHYPCCSVPVLFSCCSFVLMRHCCTTIFVCFFHSSQQSFNSIGFLCSCFKVVAAAAPPFTFWVCPAFGIPLHLIFPLDPIKHGESSIGRAQLNWIDFRKKRVELASTQKWELSCLASCAEWCCLESRRRRCRN